MASDENKNKIETRSRTSGVIKNKIKDYNEEEVIDDESNNSDGEEKSKTSSDPNQNEMKLSGAEYRCDYCRNDITSKIRIRCADCVDFDVCVRCFGRGVNVSEHRNDHRYRVIEPVDTPLFDPEWSADEESLLLEGISLYGFGNWNDVADHVGSKSKYRCETHYLRAYLESQDTPFARSILTESDVKNKTETGEDIKKLKSEIDKMKNYKYPSLQISPPPKPKPFNKELIHQTLLKAPILGFSPQRGDFETEYKNDAEKTLADIEFGADDTASDVELKIEVLRIYNKTLAERKVRKKFLLRSGLYSIALRNKRKLTEEEKEIHKNMRPFARFHSAKAHDQFLAGLCNEARIRKRIAELEQYRGMGFTAFAEIANYEKNAKTNQANEDVFAARIARPPPERRAVGRAEEKKAKGGPEKDVAGEEGAEKLSETEKNLCRALKISPNEYEKIKEAVEREAFIKGMVDADAQTARVTIEIDKTEDQMDFFLRKGWGGERDEKSDGGFNLSNDNK